jgi:hypothetical protein
LSSTINTLAGAVADIVFIGADSEWHLM